MTQDGAQQSLALVVEDDVELSHLLCFILEREGYRVAVAHDGTSALEHIRTLPPPAVVTLDIILPHVNGFELLAVMRAQPGWQRVPILMLSATSLEQSVVRALEAGANDYVVKPFKPDELRARIRRLVEPAGEPPRATGEVALPPVVAAGDADVPVLTDAYPAAKNPLPSVPLVPGALRQRNNVYAKDVGRTSLGAEVRSQPNIGHPVQRSGAAAMRVLIIDDDDDVRSLLELYLRQEWPSIVVEQLDPLTQPRPDEDFPLGAYDVVLLDYLLGRGDGLDWLQQFKRRPDCPPIIFLTGAGNEAVAVQAIKFGADSYQRKQELTRERLIAAIREATRDSAGKAVAPRLTTQLESLGADDPIEIAGMKDLRLIGEGSASRVYSAVRESDGATLVIKVLKADVASDKVARERFMEECELTERLRSRHVARVYAHGMADGHPYLVTEFLNGGDLSARLEAKRICHEESLRIFWELMSALGDAHEAGILHRDLNPRNLQFRADGSLAIVDFGIASQLSAIDRAHHSETLVSPRYLSPEQIRRRALDQRTDLYSAGVVLYEMLTGKHLFEGESASEIARQHLHTPPPALPQELTCYQPLLDKLLDKDREARFRNADEVIGFLLRKHQPYSDGPEVATSASETLAQPGGIN